MTTPTYSPTAKQTNDPGRLDNNNFTRNAGLVAAAAIFTSIFVIGMWALFYVYWYMPWHGKKLHDCCGRELDNSCSHDCVLQCKEDFEACPSKCDESCPGCQGHEPLSVRARNPTWNKAHLEGRTLPFMLAPLPPSDPVPRFPTFQPQEQTPPPPPFENRPPSVGSRGISPLAPGGNVPVYNPAVNGPRIVVEAPTSTGPTIQAPIMRA